MEVLLGNKDEKRELRFRLNSLRLFHFESIKEKYYDIQYTSISQLILDNRLRNKIDVGLFKRGIERFYKFQESLFETFAFLPLDRVFVGLYKTSNESEEKRDELGGYYSKYQTYYHLEQISTTSLLGCYISKQYNRVLTTLELLRSYFHDCIHFNTFRSYKLKYNYQKNSDFQDIHRLQYGFNFRKEDGKSFSSPDKGTVTTTRNLGIIMEGVTDEFSKISISHIIEDEKLSLSDLSYFENVILQEISQISCNHEFQFNGTFSIEEETYVARINDAYKTIWNPYYRFLSEFAISSNDEFRGFIYAAMLLGDQITFKDYFNRQLEDINAFDKLFKSPHF